MIKSPLLLTFILWSQLWLLGHAQAATELHRGFNPLGSTAVNIKGSQGGTSSGIKDEWDGLAFAISKTNSSTMCQSPNQNIPITTLDGYTGYQFAPGIMLVIYSGSLTGSRNFYLPPLNIIVNSFPYTYTFSAMGELTPNTKTEATWCADPRADQGLGYRRIPSLVSDSTKGTLLSGIYVSPNTPLGTTGSLEPLYINRGTPTNTPDSGPKITGSGLDYVVVGQLTCSVLAPPTIDFKSIKLSGNETDGTILANETGNVTVNCSGDADAELDATMSVTGTQARDTSTLKMNMVGSTTAAPAEIRGLIGPGIVQTGVCEGNSNHLGWIDFTDKDQNIAAGKLRSGSNTIPYNFTLCSTGDYVFGVAEATATMNIYWN